MRADCDVAPQGYDLDGKLATAQKTTVKLEDAGEGEHIVSVDDYSHSQTDVPMRYGLNDIYTDEDGKLYLWYAYPAGTDPQGVEAAESEANEHWYGLVAYGKKGILQKGSNIVANNYWGEDDGNTLGGFAHKGSTSIEFENTQDPQPIEPGRHWVSGYSLEPSVPGQAVTAMVANDKGEFLANVWYNGVQYTDDAGRWVYSGNVPVQLYTCWQWYSIYYGYDANVPDGASTQASGVMHAKMLRHGETTTLDACAYTLPGYRFTGWNTEPNGKGTSYKNLAAFNADNYGQGTNLVLYAQWEALEYQVKLNVQNPDGTNQSRIIQATFDEPVELSWEESIPGNATIAGWEGLGLGSPGILFRQHRNAEHRRWRACRMGR